MNWQRFVTAMVTERDGALPFADLAEPAGGEAMLGQGGKCVFVTTLAKRIISRSEIVLNAATFGCS
jgi:hypothetical protein